MSSLSFIIDDRSTGGTNPQVSVTVTEVGGTLVFQVSQVVTPGAAVGDLRGFFFDLGDESLAGKLSIGGTTAAAALTQGNDSVVDLGGGATMSGLTNASGAKTSKVAGAEANGYDVGVTIGTAGIGNDDVQAFSFTLSGPRALSLADLSGADFGVRLTSVGVVSAIDAAGNPVFAAGREASSKIAEGLFSIDLAIAGEDAAALEEDAPAAGNLLATSTPTAAQLSLDGFTLLGQHYDFSAGSSVTIDLPDTFGAVLTVNADGTYSIDAGASKALAWNDTLTFDLAYGVTATYREADGSVAGQVATSSSVTLTVEGENDGPVAVDDAGFTVAEGATHAAAGSLLDNDSDADHANKADLQVTAIDGNALAFDADGWASVAVAGGILRIARDGAYTFTADDSADLGAGQSLQGSFTYTLWDGIDSATAAVAYTVTGTSPVVEPPPGGGGGSTPLDGDHFPLYGSHSGFSKNAISHVSFLVDVDGDAATTDYAWFKVEGGQIGSNAAQDLDTWYADAFAAFQQAMPAYAGSTLLGAAIKASTHETYFALDGNADADTPPVPVAPGKQLVTTLTLDDGWLL